MYVCIELRGSRTASLRLHYVLSPSEAEKHPLVDMYVLSPGEVEQHPLVSVWFHWCHVTTRSHPTGEQQQQVSCYRTTLRSGF